MTQQTAPTTPNVEDAAAHTQRGTLSAKNETKKATE